MDRQTRLQRMKEYDVKTRQLNTRKGKARSAALAPPVAPLPELRPGQQAPPSYLQQDQERGTKDDGTPQSEQQEQKQEENVAKQVNTEVGKRDFAQGKKTTTTVSTTTKAKQQVKSNYASYLGHLSNRTVPIKYHLKNFTWLPNSIMMERILFATHSVLRPSEYLWKHHKNYLSIMVTLYYSILFYVQILRVQSAIGKIDKTDSTWYRAFSRLYPDEKLVIAGPLEPIFNAIAAFKSDDERFGILYPRLPNFAEMFKRNTTTATEWDLNNNEMLSVPNVPGLFQAITTYVKDDFNVDRDTMPKHQIKYGTGAGNRTVLNVPQFATGSWYYATSMLNRPHPETRDQYTEAQHFWLQTELEEAHVGKITPPNAGRGDNAGYDNVGEFLQFTRKQDGNNVEHGFTWFGDLLNAALVHSRFFEGVTNLSAIDTISGLDVPIMWLVDTLNHKDKDITAPSTQYPGLFKSLRARARIVLENTDSLDVQTSSIHMINTTVCYGQNPRLTGFPELTRDGAAGRRNAFWNEQSIYYEDGSFQEVIVGETSDMQADFYVPGGL